MSWALETNEIGIGMGSKIVVGIPAYNEERAIADVVARALPHAAEVVVVDDGSADQTALHALRAGAVIIRHSVNSGKGAAVVALFQYAIDHMADVLVLIDGDGQHDPDEIPAVAAPCVENRADVVVGSRFVAEARSATPFVRKLGQHAFNAMTTLASGVRCSDSQSGFRAFRRRAFCAMRLSETSFSVECEMQFEVRKRGLILAEVPITCRYDQPPKRNVVSHGAGVLSRLTAMAFRRRMFGRVPTINPPLVGRTLVSRSQPGGLVLSEVAVVETDPGRYPARFLVNQSWSGTPVGQRVERLPALSRLFAPGPFGSGPTVRSRHHNASVDAPRASLRVDSGARDLSHCPLIWGLPEGLGIGRSPPQSGRCSVSRAHFVSVRGLF
jgi:hypothetical protein